MKIKSLPLLLAYAFCLNSYADSLTLPSATDSTRQEITTPDGFRCSESLGSPTSLEFGTLYTDDRDNPVGSVYGRITVPLGRRVERLNCNRLMELWLRKLESESAMDAYR